MAPRVMDTLPTYDHVLFRATHLELALVQVKYPPLPRFTEAGYLTSFQESLALSYPIPNVEAAVALVASPQGMQTSTVQVHRFSSIDRTWSVVLTNDAVALECRSGGYSEVRDFAARFCAVLEAVQSTLKPRLQLRFGLRYINELRHPKAKTFEAWKELGLNPDMLGIAARNVFGGEVTQTVNEVVTKRSDGQLLIRHGALSGTTVMPVLNSAPKQGPFYLLDLDYYDEQPGDFNPHPLDRIILYNEFLYRIFRWCIGEGEMFRYLRENA